MDSENEAVRRSRRGFLSALALAGGAAMLAACGGSTGNTATPQASEPTSAPQAAATQPADTSAPPTVAPSSGQVTIEWFNRYTTETTQQVIPLMVGEFEKQYPNIKVNYQNPGMARAMSRRCWRAWPAATRPISRPCMSRRLSLPPATRSYRSMT